MRTLHLTTPELSGPDVRSTQELLNSKGFDCGAPDGQYGPETAAAAKRAKYALGYPKASIDGNCGDLLRAYLSGRTKLPLAYRVRARARKPKPQPETLQSRVLALASKQIGIKENPPGSNEVLFSRWYGITGPWCAMFVSWCYAGCGSKQFVQGHRFAYVPYILNAAMAGDGMHVTSKPIPGDLVLYDWNGDGVCDHVGLFSKWISSTQFEAIEGNTGVGNDSNGGETERRDDRYISNVRAFVHVID